MKADLARLREIAGPVSRETAHRLVRFAELVAHWSPRINLIGGSTASDIWTRHVLDSAQLVPLSKGVESWADLGAGAGFPGLVVAILLQELSPSKPVWLLESNRKKASFLELAAGTVGLSAVSVKPARAPQALENLSPSHLSARALAPLAHLLELAERPLSSGAVGLFHKGRDFAKELEEADSRWAFDVIQHPNRVLPGGLILEIANLRRRRADI